MPLRATPPPVAPRVLLVEDETKAALALRRTLEQEGFAVKACVDGSAAAGLLAGEPFDVVVLD